MSGRRAVSSTSRAGATPSASGLQRSLSRTSSVPFVLDRSWRIACSTRNRAVRTTTISRSQRTRAVHTPSSSSLTPSSPPSPPTRTTSSSSRVMATACSRQSRVYPKNKSSTTSSLGTPLRWLEPRRVSPSLSPLSPHALASPSSSGILSSTRRCSLSASRSTKPQRGSSTQAGWEAQRGGAAPSSLPARSLMVFTRVPSLTRSTRLTPYSNSNTRRAAQACLLRSSTLRRRGPTRPNSVRHRSSSRGFSRKTLSSTLTRAQLR
mmetsp:Transcript_58988/g.117194  ORF Transcript_58988/g.117194 Transcript_58988/m.117194 type:complete len:264 (-) Transcript_58988:584-1375(-)